MNNQPLISVVMPIYNAALYLPAALASILAQTERNFEVIAVDDGSTDSSKAILDAIAAREPRLRVISRPNTGIVGALNDGLAAAQGEFIARMDGDDIALPERFARQLAFLKANPECVCVGSYFVYIDKYGASLRWNPRETDSGKIEAELIKGNGGALIHPSVMLRAEAVRRVGGYREEAQWVEDLDLYLRLARIGSLANIPEVLLHYRHHAQSVNFTRNVGRHQRKLWVMEDACRARGLPFDPAAWPAPAIKTQVTAEEARAFAIDSLRFPGWRTPWRYTLQGLMAAPRDRRSWKVLSYMAKTTLGLVARPS